MNIIGLSGYARSGKDEAAKVLGEFGFKRIAFADKLRDMLYALNPMVGIEGEPFEGGLDYVGVQMVIDRHGWDGYKETEHGPQIRRLLQRLGTEAGRETMWENIWVDAALKNLNENDKIVITDVRFINEAQAIEDAGGQIWRIKRTGFGPVNDHPSETALDRWNFTKVISNNGDLEQYHEAIRKAYIKEGHGILWAESLKIEVDK